MEKDMSGFEEQNWNDLAEKFIAKHQDLWNEFVCEAYEDYASQEPPDYSPED